MFVFRRITRYAIFALLALGCLYVFSRSGGSGSITVIDPAAIVAEAPVSVPAAVAELDPQPHAEAAPDDNLNGKDTPVDTTPVHANALESLHFKHHKDTPREKVVEDNYNQLVSILQQVISEPKVDNLVRPINPSTYKLANATLMIMARNQDLRGVLYTMRQIEEKFNSKFHYPYVILNDGDFKDNFIDRVTKMTTSKVYFEKIEPEEWNQPDWIDSSKQKSQMKVLKQQNIAYANKVSYHNMCRYYSINFFNHPRMREFKYYWRFEPNTDYFCDIDYDVFKFMEMNNKVYGFVISLYDAQETMPSLWPETLKFLNKNKNYLNKNAAIDFLMEDMQNPVKTEFTGGYSTCHFWSNFEIADMDFYRGEAYTEWTKHLDQTGGFYYERWGDAPVHTLGVGLFADRNDVHWFRDIGYKHHPYTNCPHSDKCHGCEPGLFTYEHLKDQNCLTNWWNYEMDDTSRQLY
ncbi:hypothetical protein PICMEDRAFT_8914 [Pichia membranifaciens NRRL Y-2026]|uniref:Glycosyltransferase family 15 protein n=1 Tax=Pichia membranifaciens NRRL Y-2026 TaxID=763406 RepID=A0A1E3NQP8_9ASCO|nr:hypothetical protein PICMEDRAFT_8914 [Pichia membranifaciens NRRL Y-2026]ODQ48366.1 hypothetical protein PICMEDRAFT_8914 [Pichia membranifaciens NRRL Y-2026]